MTRLQPALRSSRARKRELAPVNAGSQRCRIDGRLSVEGSQRDRARLALKCARCKKPGTTMPTEVRPGAERAERRAAIARRRCRNSAVVEPVIEARRSGAVQERALVVRRSSDSAHEVRREVRSQIGCLEPVEARDRIRLALLRQPTGARRHAVRFAATIARSSEPYAWSSGCDAAPKRGRRRGLDAGRAHTLPSVRPGDRAGRAGSAPSLPG